MNCGKLFISIFISILYLYAFPQNRKIDSLKILLKKDREDTTKILHLNFLSYELCINSDFKSALNYGISANKLAIKLNFIKGIAKSYNNIGLVYDYQGIYDSALYYYGFALEKYKEDKNQKFIASAYNNIGNIYNLQDNYTKALENYFCSLKIKKNINDKAGVASAYNNIALIYDTKKDYSKALIYYSKSLKMYNELKNFEYVATLYINLGIIYINKKNYINALKCFNKSLKISKQYNYKYITSKSYYNIGNIYYFQKYYSKSLDYYFKSLELSEEIKDYYTTTGCYYQIGLDYTELNKKEKAEKYFNKSLELSKKINYKSCIRDNYRNLSDIYSNYGDYKKAYEFLIQNSLYRDTLDIEGQENYYKKLVQIEREIKKQEYKRIKERIDNKTKQSHIIIYSIISGVILLMIILFLFFNSYRHKQFAKHIKLEKESMQSQFNALKSQINPHFLFNTLNTLITVIEENKGSAIDFVEQLSNTYRLILESRDKELYEIKEELKFINSYSVILLKRFENRLTININIAEKYLDYSIPPLCLQLLIENVTKHNIISAKYPMTIDIYTEEDMLVIKNNKQMKSIPAQSTKVGLENIKNRYKYFTDRKVEIINDLKEFIIKLPLIKQQTNE